VSIVARLEEIALAPPEELAALLASAKGDGAVVSFTGVARSASKQGAPLTHLILDHHPVLTLRSLEAIAAEAAERPGVTHVRVVHRCGGIAAGEPIVFAGAASQNRRAAFEAADYLMDRLKTDAVFWKSETWSGGSAWIEPTEADYADRERWN
jgi:molybdopterin synthase catalytic subunit